MEEIGDMRGRRVNIGLRPDGTTLAYGDMPKSSSMKLVGYRPDGSFLKVRMEMDTPDGTYWLPGVQIVIRTSAGWSLWRYVLTILKGVLWSRNPPMTNLILAGAGIGRLAGVSGIRRLKGWAADRGVFSSGHERSFPCLCRNCIGRERPSGSSGCRGGRSKEEPTPSPA